VNSPVKFAKSVAFLITGAKNGRRTGMKCFTVQIVAGETNLLIAPLGDTNNLVT
jgi:hypothetical protein